MLQWQRKVPLTDTAPCLTPDGLYWLRSRARPLLGFEAMTLMGFHWTRVPAAFHGDEAHLRDLAGNAFNAFHVSILVLAMQVHLPCLWGATS